MADLHDAEARTRAMAIDCRAMGDNLRADALDRVLAELDATRAARDEARQRALTKLQAVTSHIRFVEDEESKLRAELAAVRAELDAARARVAELEAVAKAARAHCEAGWQDWDTWKTLAVAVGEVDR